MIRDGFNRKIETEIISTIVLDEIPSASGISKSAAGIYIIGDNTPYLYELNSDFKLSSKTPIYSTQNLRGETIPKKLKPDFEAIETVGEKELIIFGSGSNTRERNYFLRIFFGEKLNIETYNLSSFYDKLRKLEVMKDQKLNIEAVAVYENKLYLFNRRKNIIFTFNYDHFIQFIKGGDTFPDPEIIEVDLPKINGIEAGFSGATTLQTGPTILFTASVENTSNSYDDGRILGSFIGLIDVFNIQTPSSYRYALIENTDTPVKVESLTVLNEISSNEADLLLVTDSDGDKSLLIKCRIRW